MCCKMISRLSTFFFGSSDSKYSNPIQLIRLEEYVDKAVKKEYLQMEFDTLNPTDKQLKSWDIAKIPENKVKHRYYREPDSLLTYDHTRVILDKIPGEDYTDFIAANWINGYNHPKRYIGTQCPTFSTTNDFYRMIWQFGVQQIINLTSPYDMEIGKCFKYFPDDEYTYGEIQVKLLSKEETTDIVIRNYQLEKDKEIRLMTHLHYLAWPDHEVPEHPQYLFNIINKYRSDKLYTNDKPIVVHCVAGVGRTGTLILADIMLEMSRNEEYVDFFGHLWKLRKQRINMVARPEQYICVHHAIVAAQKISKTIVKS